MDPCARWYAFGRFCSLLFLSSVLLNTANILILSLWTRVINVCLKTSNSIFDILYSLMTSIGIVKPKRMSWMGKWHAWGEMRNSYRVLLESLNGRGCLNDLGIDGTIIILLRNMGVGCGLDSFTAGFRPDIDQWQAGCYEHGNENLGTIKCRKFLDWVRICCLFKNDCPVP